MKIMSSVRDLVLNYAYNVAKNEVKNKLEFQEQVNFSGQQVDTLS